VVVAAAAVAEVGIRSLATTARRDKLTLQANQHPAFWRSGHRAGPSSRPRTYHPFRPQSELDGIEDGLAGDE